VQFSPVALVGASGALRERVYYDAYGLPRSLSPADQNADGVVDSQDSSLLLGNWGSIGGTYGAQGDIDRDGDVDSADYALLSGAWGQAAPPKGELSAFSNQIGFHGHRYENVAGLYTMRFRHHSPGLGRFIERDPIGYVDGANLFEFVSGAPTYWVDPMGLCPDYPYGQHPYFPKDIIPGKVPFPGRELYEDGGGPAESGGAGGGAGGANGGQGTNQAAPGAETSPVGAGDPTIGEEPGFGGPTEQKLPWWKVVLEAGTYVPVVEYVAGTVLAGHYAYNGQWQSAGLSVGGMAPGPGGYAADIARAARLAGAAKKLGLGTRKAGGTIYEVPGAATSSGRDYIGRHNGPNPAKTRRSADGRDRSQAKVIDRYDKRNTSEGRQREQRAIDNKGGVKKLDNKRNEVAKRKPQPGSP